MKNRKYILAVRNISDETVGYLNIIDHSNPFEIVIHISRDYGDDYGDDCITFETLAEARKCRNSVANDYNLNLDVVRVNHITELEVMTYDN